MQKDPNEKILIVIDGNAIMHRAFHALPPLVNAKGIETGAVYGFFAMILKIVQEIEPTHVVVTFDRPKPTFRKQLYVGYQANRPQMDEGLGQQIDAIHTLLKDVKIPIFEVDGFEADDVIGTIANKTIKELTNLRVIIVTGDRDLLQLVTDRVQVLAPVVGISKMKLYDTEKVREKYGINPSQIVSYKALIGDSSDNYPGVPGIGPKTAIKLLSDYSTVDGVYEHISEIEKKNQKLALKLAQGQESAQLCKTLATIMQDVPLVYTFEQTKFPQASLPEYDKAFENFGFRTLRTRLQEVFGEKKEVESEKPKKRANQLQLLD